MRDAKASLCFTRLSFFHTSSLRYIQYWVSKKWPLMSTVSSSLTIIDDVCSDTEHWMTNTGMFYELDCVTSYILSLFTSSSPEPNSFHLAMNDAAEVDRKHLLSYVSTEHTDTLPAAQTDSLIVIKPPSVHTEDSRPELHLLVTGFSSFCHAWIHTLKTGHIPETHLWISCLELGMHFPIETILKTMVGVPGNL